MNLIPFPRVSHSISHSELSTDSFTQLHFLMPSYAPFYDPKAKHFEKNSVAELTKAFVFIYTPYLFLWDYLPVY